MQRLRATALDLLLAGRLPAQSSHKDPRVRLRVPLSGLFSPKTRLAFLQKSRDAFALVLCREEHGLGEPLDDESGLLVRLEAGLHGELGETHGERPPAEYGRGRRSHFVHQSLVVPGDLGHEADAVGFFGVYYLAGQDHLYRPAFADEPAEALRTAGAGDDRERHLRQPEPGVSGGNAYVTSHRKLAAPPQRQAGDGGERWRLVGPVLV